MELTKLEQLEMRMAEYWQVLLETPLALEIQKVLSSGDKQLYALWLCQVAHLTKHTSAHQGLVGTRYQEISHQYMKFCFEHAAEEVGHEMMAVHDLRKIGLSAKTVSDLPAPLPATEKLTAYLYYAAQYSHPATRLGFSYWAEKCYPFIQGLAANTKKSLGLQNSQMTFFVSHSEIDEKHAQDVERIVQIVCQAPADWQAVETGMIDTLNLSVEIFREIQTLMNNPLKYPHYGQFLETLNGKSDAKTSELL